MHFLCLLLVLYVMSYFVRSLIFYRVCIRSRPSRISSYPLVSDVVCLSLYVIMVKQCMSHLRVFVSLCNIFCAICFCKLLCRNSFKLAGLDETGLFRQNVVDESGLCVSFMIRQGSQRIRCDSLTSGLVDGLISVSSAKFLIRQGL